MVHAPPPTPPDRSTANPPWTANPVAVRALAGGLGGLLVFLFLEPVRHASGVWGDGPFSAYPGPMAPGVAIGVLLTALLVAADEWRGGSTPRMVVRTLGGAILGGVCGWGWAIWAYWMYGIGQVLGLAPDPWTRDLLGRGIAWSIFGLGAGLSAGIACSGGRRSYQGLAGGIIGGFLGGILFQLLTWAGADPALRLLLGFVALGTAVGVSIALVERFTRLAWLTYLSGAREGTELTLAKETVALGRSELVEVPLFGDPAVGKRQAVLSLFPHPHIRDVGEVPLLEVDGYTVRDASLDDGSVIRMGRHRLRFHCRAELLPGPNYRPPASQVFEHLLTPANELEAEAPLPFPITGERRETASGDASAYLQRVAEADQQLLPHGGLALRLLGGSQRWVPLGDQPLTLGRDPTASIPLPDLRISRLHAQVERMENAWVLRDLGSTNGTRVNGVRVSRIGLCPGDRIEVGDTVLLVEGGFS